MHLFAVINFQFLFDCGYCCRCSSNTNEFIRLIAFLVSLYKYGLDFIVDLYSFVWLYHILFIHSSVDGYLGCLLFLANAVVNILARIFLWTCILAFLVYILGSGIVGP